MKVSVSADLAEALRSEYSRLQKTSPKNPGTLDWDTFLTSCLRLGLEESKKLSAEEALNLVLNAKPAESGNDK
jgi:hypothetical protein